MRRIVLPLRAVETSVKAIAAGNYAQEVPFTQATDEIGSLARSVEILKQSAEAMAEHRWVSASAAKLVSGLPGATTLAEFGVRVRKIRDDLTGMLRQARAEGKRVVGYGATAKSATVTNFCGIGAELVPFVCDTTPAKQGRLTPGTHIPVRQPAAFADPYPDYALLVAWNHADEIMAKEQAFREAGGRWIQYVPDVHVS